MNGEPAPRGKKQYYGRTAKVGAVWGVLRQFGNELVAVPTSIVLARLLTPREFGIAAAATFFVVLAARLSEFGFNVALVRNKDLRPEHISSVFVVKLVMGVLTWGSLKVAAPFVGQFYQTPEAGQVLPLAGLVFLITPFGTIPSTLMQRHLQFRQAAVSEWVDSLTQAVVTISLAWSGFSFWSLIWGYIAGASAGVATRLLLTRWRPDFSFSLRALRELSSYGFGIQSKRLLDYAAQNLDNVIIGKTLDMTALGLYDKAFTTMGRLVNRLTLGGGVSFRIFAIICDETERFRRAYAKVALTTTLIGTPALAGCIVVAPELFIVLYGPQWTAAVNPFRILCLAGILKLVNSFVHRANEASGLIWWQVGQQVLYVVSVVVGVIIGSRWGLPGAATGVLCATALQSLLAHALLRRAAGFRVRDMVLPQLPSWICAAGAVAVLATAGATFRLIVQQPPAWQRLLVEGVAGALFYIVFLLGAPIAEVRAVVAETLHDLVPALARRFPRLAQLPGASGPAA